MKHHYSAEEVRVMRSEINDEEFLSYVRSHPARYVLDRPLVIPGWYDPDTFHTIDSLASANVK